jgi:hypothetical protein
MATSFISSIEREIAQVHPEFFYVIVVIAIAICGYAFHRMSTSFNYARTIDMVPTAKIRSAAQGYVELIGKTKLMKGPIIISPLTQTVCVWFRYKVELETTTTDTKGRSKTHWKTIKSGISDDIFLLEDETGRCVIDPDDADVFSAEKNVWMNNSLSSKRRYTEEIIREQQSLYSIGLFTTLADIEGNKHRDDINQLLRHWKTDPNQILHDFDTDNDGEVSLDEWDHAHKKAELQVLQQQGHRENTEQLSVLKAPKNKHQPFILSTLPEDALVRRYYFKSLAGFAVFLLLGGLVVWSINVRIGLT